MTEGHALCRHSILGTDSGDSGSDAVRAAALDEFALTGGVLGDPDAMVPFWRAPNGSWGVTAEVAVELGMQPLDETLVEDGSFTLALGAE